MQIAHALTFLYRGTRRGAGATLLDIDDDRFFANLAGVRQDISCLVDGEEVSGERKVLLIYVAPAFVFHRSQARAFS